MSISLHEASLERPPINRTANGGIGHAGVYADWSHNLAQAEADLPLAPEYGQRAVAAYMTIGTPGHVEFIVGAAMELWEATLDPADYIGSHDLAPEDDADGDGVWNRLEWMQIVEEYQIVQPDLDDALTYTQWAMDPSLPAREDIDIGLDLPDGDGSDWDYSHLPQATVTFNSAPDLPVEVRILDPPGREDVPVPIGQPVDIPLGAELLITLAEGANPDWFYTWNAPGNMIDGSAEKTERFRLMSGQAISPERRSICGAELPTDPGDGSGYVWEWTGLGPLGHMIAPDESAGSETVYAPQEAHVRLRAYRITEAPPGSGVGDDKKYANVITYQNINDTYTVLGSPTINIARVPLVLGAGIMSHPDHGYLNHMLSAGDGGNAYLSGPNSVGGRLALGGLTTARPAPEASADYVSAYCIPSPGYEPGAWHGDFTVVGPPPNQHHIADATVTYESGATSGGVAFIKKQTLELEVKVEGAGTPAEAGHLGAGTSVD